jgi:hypothetical protein
MPASDSPSPVSPPPWPPFDGNTQRSHIVVDGDSLAKLAGRYLNDPQRGAEIFELNRGLLTNPDLLPIGVELRIPPRQPNDSPMGSAFNRQGARPVDAAVRSGMVPVRPVPAGGTTAPPRAQLLRPVPAE